MTPDFEKNQQIEREPSISEILALSPEEKIRAIRHRIATKEYETPIYVDFDHEPEPDRTAIHLYLTEEEIAFLYLLLDEKERHCRGIIKRNANYPTYNAKALRSDEKQKATIARIEALRAQITDQ